jgi:repressor of nif and glnA expression
MTLLDYFAAKAMQSVSLALDKGEQQLIANAAYAQAEAMIKARAAISKATGE